MSTSPSEHALRLADGDLVPLIIRRHPRARCMRLRYDGPSGQARLTIPPRAALRKALRWAEEQAGWLTRQRAHAGGGIHLGVGLLLPFEGAPVQIVADGGGRRVRLEADRLIVGGPPELTGQRLLRWLKATARERMTAESLALAARHDLPLQRVSIGDPRSRWGSCSAGGAIRYSWRLILAPPFVRQATVAHEVAHLRHMNHGPEFHALVRAISPADPDQARAWLRHEGAALHRYMA